MRLYVYVCGACNNVDILEYAIYLLGPFREDGAVADLDPQTTTGAFTPRPVQVSHAFEYFFIARFVQLSLGSSIFIQPFAHSFRTHALSALEVGRNKTDMDGFEPVTLGLQISYIWFHYREMGCSDDNRMEKKVKTNSKYTRSYIFFFFFSIMRNVVSIFAHQEKMWKLPQVHGIVFW